MLVCGLGQLGRACIAALRGYGVPVLALDLRQPADAAALGLTRLTLGDLRDPETLRAAGAHACRAILFVSGDARQNLQGALAARHLCPTTRIVIRAEQEARYENLSHQLGDLVAYVPHRLSAASFALAALDSEVVAHFYVRERLFQVIEHLVAPGDPRLGRTVDSIENAETRVLLALGEHVSDVFRLRSAPVMVTEYVVEESDTLHGCEPWEIAESYGVVPMLLPHEAPARGERSSCQRALHRARSRPPLLSAVARRRPRAATRSSR